MVTNGDPNDLTSCTIYSNGTAVAPDWTTVKIKGSPAPQTITATEVSPAKRPCLRVANALCDLPWAILPGKLEAIVDLIEARAIRGEVIDLPGCGRQAPVNHRRRRWCAARPRHHLASREHAQRHLGRHQHRTARP